MSKSVSPTKMHRPSLLAPSLVLHLSNQVIPPRLDYKLHVIVIYIIIMCVHVDDSPKHCTMCNTCILCWMQLYMCGPKCYAATTTLFGV